MYSTDTISPRCSEPGLYCALQVFPPDWEMSERLAAEFCRVTRGELGRLLQARQSEVKWCQSPDCICSS